jgi:hypothetical protein
LRPGAPGFVFHSANFDGGEVYCHCFHTPYSILRIYSTYTLHILQVSSVESEGDGEAE